jgi:hypothetical protein
MKKLARVTEAQVIAEFLKNEFYQEDFHRDREKFEQVVLNADLNDEIENGLRRALLFRRRGHMWRELPPDTQWWRVEIEPRDVEMIRVFPRAQWRKIAEGSFLLDDIVRRIRKNHYGKSVKPFVSKIQSLSYRLRSHPDSSSVMLIAVDPEHPMTILEGNHRLTAALLISPEALQKQFQVLCGFSPNMRQCCWYETNVRTLWRYFKNRLENFYDREADVSRALNDRPLTGRPTVVEAKAAVADAITNSALEQN